MSEIESSIDRSIAAYWLSVASKGEGGKNVALNQAAALLRDARSEARIPDGPKQPTLNEMEAPPLDVLKGPTRRR
jgi:hypothetical protein